MAECVGKASGSIRWVSHQKMPADGLTHPDVRRSNGALEHLVKTGIFALVQEDVELKERSQGGERRSRSRAATNRRLQAEDEET